MIAVHLFCANGSLLLLNVWWGQRSGQRSEVCVSQRRFTQTETLSSCFMMFYRKGSVPSMWQQSTARWRWPACSCRRELLLMLLGRSEVFRSWFSLRDLLHSFHSAACMVVGGVASVLVRDQFGKHDPEPELFLQIKLEWRYEGRDVTDLWF